MSKKQRIYLSLFSGLLFVPAWYQWGSGIFLFIAFIPLLFAEADLVRTGKRSREFFLLPFLTFFVWNVLTTWWIKNASFAGLITALIVNSAFMTIPFWLFSLTHRKLGNSFGYFSLLFYWVAFEYFYLNGEISWTWLNLGNGFANNIKMIQWYEFTGVLGGTFWVLCINLLLFKALSKYLETKNLRYSQVELSTAAILLIVPMVISHLTFNNYEEKEKPYEIVVIQPNIDPYMKFNDIPPEEQMNILIRLADSLADQNTDYIVAPETFINDNMWLESLESNPHVKRLRELSLRYPGAKIIIGATTYKLYENSGESSPTARPFRGDTYFDSFNSALQIDTTGVIPVYHKSELVVGVEKMPYTQYLGFLRKIMLQLGGTFRSHGTQEYRDAFPSPQDGTRVGPAICYESIFGEFVTEYVKDAGANFIFVITNDGWWGETPGYIQHNSFSALRAIENRRSIARSANTGISSFFNQKGEILQMLGWWERDAIKDTLNANDEITFYTLHGDYFGRISTFAGIALLLYTITSFLMKDRMARHRVERRS
jgi:apolipoprotein N-acyltransferase